MLGTMSEKEDKRALRDALLALIIVAALYAALNFLPQQQRESIILPPAQPLPAHEAPVPPKVTEPPQQSVPA
jgi:hypothetical protein